MTSRKKKQIQGTLKHSHRRHTRVVVCLMLALTLSVGILAQWKGVVGNKMAQAFSGAAPRAAPVPFAPMPLPPPSSPSKEYIYAGNRLVATEEPGPSSVNRALGKTATQSSDFVNGGITFSASRAIDGNTNGDFWNGNSSATTNYASQNWWQVDLQSVGQISKISIWPRSDCCPEMTGNFYVFVSDNAFTSTDLTTTINQTGVSRYQLIGNATGTPNVITINRTGRYVRVQRSDTQYLVLAEVQVWGS
jgi:hypothetical protein